MFIQASAPNSATPNRSATGARPHGPSASPSVTPLRATRHTSGDLKRVKTVIGAIVIVISVGIVLLLITQLPLTWRSKNSSQLISDAAANNHFDAKVFIDTTGSGDCQQEVFDNQTWRMTRSRQPCDATALDANGIPIPKGTMHRLDAISKSFREK